jgi:hypothetical protein
MRREERVDEFLASRTAMVPQPELHSTSSSHLASPARSTTFNM